jgi:L-aminopeptidase/D-esterase-like protein
MGKITDVPGVRVGHAEDPKAITGCTVILFDNDARGAVDLRGGGTSTRQIDPLLEHHAFGGVQAILLTGGSAYGLSAADGVMRYLEENRRGLDVGGGFVVPSVPTAVIFDLRIGDGRVRPDAAMAYEACLAARADVVEEGSVGVGIGATVGKILGISHATKGGVGSASCTVEGGAWVGVLVVVNAFGDVVNSGERIAGVRDLQGGSRFLGTVELIKQGVKQRVEPFENTTIAVVATNASFPKTELVRIARVGQTGIARAISPCHTSSDGDIVFAVSTGNLKADPNVVAIMAGELIAEAIVRAIYAAKGMGGIPSHRELFEHS